MMATHHDEGGDDYGVCQHGHDASTCRVCKILRRTDDLDRLRDRMKDEKGRNL